MKYMSWFDWLMWGVEVVPWLHIVAGIGATLYGMPMYIGVPFLVLWWMGGWHKRWEHHIEEVRQYNERGRYLWREAYRVRQEIHGHSEERILREWPHPEEVKASIKGLVFGLYISQEHNKPPYHKQAVTSRWSSFSI